MRSSHPTVKEHSVDELFPLSKRLVDIACDMKIKDETTGQKRTVELSHWELCKIIDHLTLGEAVRAIQKQERQ